MALVNDSRTSSKNFLRVSSSPLAPIATLYASSPTPSPPPPPPPLPPSILRSLPKKAINFGRTSTVDTNAGVVIGWRAQHRGELERRIVDVVSDAPILCFSHCDERKHVLCLALPPACPVCQSPLMTGPDSSSSDSGRSASSNCNRNRDEPVLLPPTPPPPASRVMPPPSFPEIRSLSPPSLASSRERRLLERTRIDHAAEPLSSSSQSQSRPRLPITADGRGWILNGNLPLTSHRSHPAPSSSNTVHDPRITSVISSASQSSHHPVSRFSSPSLHSDSGSRSPFPPPSHSQVAFRLPSPFRRGCESSCCVVIRPSVGSFLHDYRLYDDLHIGIADSKGVVHDFDKGGIRVRNNYWNQCLVLNEDQLHNFSTRSPPTIFSTSPISSSNQRWDEALKRCIDVTRWTADGRDAYDGEINNCLDFVLHFLNLWNASSVASSFANNPSSRESARVAFTRRRLLPLMESSMKYILLYRKLLQTKVWVHEDAWNDT